MPVNRAIPRAGVFCVLLAINPTAGAQVTKQGVPTESPARDAITPREDAKAAAASPVTEIVEQLVQALRRYPARPTTNPNQVGLFLLDPRQGGPVLIASEPDARLDRLSGPVWSHDGTRIAFTAAGGASSAPVMRMKIIDADEGRPRVRDLGAGAWPDFSPNDARILFFERKYDLKEPGGVFLMKADGSGRQLLGTVGVPITLVNRFGRPRWGPNGREFFIADSMPRVQLTIVDTVPESSGVVVLPDNRQIHSVPGWVAPGTILAALSILNNQPWEIALLDVSKPGESQIKESLWKGDQRQSLIPSFPIYNEATKTYAFVGRNRMQPAENAAANTGPKPWGIYTFKAGDKAPALLNKAEFELPATDLAFSPDGRYVLFCSNLSAQSRVPRGRAQSVVAPAVSGITIDGDLKDWPAAMPRQPIDNAHQFYFTNSLGPRQNAFMSTSADLSACFMVGYDPKDQLLKLAVIVRDDKLVVGNTSPWDTDSIEVYVDGLHKETSSPLPNVANWVETVDAGELPLLQYIGIPGKGRVYGVMKSSGVERGEENPILTNGDIKKTKTQMAFKRTGDVTVYEWSIQAFDHYPDQPTKLEPGVQIGFDIVICDRDAAAEKPVSPGDPEIERPVWVCWGPSWRMMKHFDPANLGEIIIGRAP